MKSFRTTLLMVAATPILFATLMPESGPNRLELGPLDDFRSFAHSWHSADALAVVANVALFVPLGIALALRGLTGLRATLTGLFLAAAIELAQLLIPGRTTSTDDVISNTLGCAIGWVLLRGAQRAVRGSRRRRRPHPAGREIVEHTR